MAGPTFLDFDVAVARRADNLDVRVLDSPAGETGSVLSPLPDRLLTAAPVGPTASRALRPVRPQGEGPDPVAVGSSLFTALFNGPVLARYVASRHRAAVAGAGLRIMLRFEDSTDALPWELLHDPQLGRFLALDPRTPIVRCTETEMRDLVAPQEGPLRVLVAVSSPAATAPIDAVAERAAVTKLLEPLMVGSALVVEVLEDASLERIRAVLADREVHIFHYIGHGTVTDDDKSALVLTDATGAPTVRTASALAAVLATAPSLRLALLNSCHGSVSDPTDPFAGAAATLVRAGLPAVIAMRAVISNEAAVDFATGLDRELADGATVEQAVSLARASLAAADSAAAREWPTVALHLSSSLPTWGTAGLLPPLDEDVEFTVARPAHLTVEEWTAMLVFAHHGREFVADDGHVVNQPEQVRNRIASFFGGSTAVETTSERSSLALPRGAELVVVPDFPGAIECDPPQAAVVWKGDVAEARFLLRARVHLVGSFTGWVRVFCGPVVVAQTHIELTVGAEAATAAAPPVPEPMQRYRKIFPCFAPEDVEVVDGVVAVAQALGDQYTESVVTAQREGAPTGWLLDLITGADAFQLFWSSHSMASSACREQWERALATQRDGFILPLYWEDPFPRTADLPPPGLEALRFARLPVARREPPPVAAVVEAPSVTSEPWYPTPGASTPPPPRHSPSVPPATSWEPPPPARTRSAPPEAGSPRRRRVLAGVGLSLAGIAGAFVAAVLLGEGPTAVQPPGGGGGASSSAAGLVVAGVALVLVVTGLLLLFRGRRR